MEKLFFSHLVFTEIDFIKIFNEILFQVLYFLKTKETLIHKNNSFTLVFTRNDIDRIFVEFLHFFEKLKIFHA